MEQILRIVKMQCLNMHQDNFQHFEPGIPDLADYDLGIKMEYNEAPPPPGSRSEPRLYLHVSVRELKTQQYYNTIHYARRRTFLKDKPPGGKGDEKSLKSDVLRRLAADVKALVAGTRTSEENPIFVQSIS